MKQKAEKSEKQLAQIVGALIANRRKAKGLTQAQLAEQMEIEKETVSRIETGTISPTLARLAQLAKLLDCEIGDLVQENSPEAADQAMALLTRMENLTESQRIIVLRLLGRIVTAMSNLNQRDGKVVEKFLNEI